MENPISVTQSTVYNYPNITVNASLGCEDKGEDEPCRMFLFIFYVPIYGFIVLFGLVGNTVSFMVLQWEKQNHVATFLLQCLSVADNCFLLTAGFSQIFASMSLYIGFYDEANSMIPYVSTVVWPLVHVTQMITVWMTVLVAANRYIAICKPFQAPKLCTLSRVRLQVVTMLLLCTLYNIPRFLEFDIKSKFNRCLGREIKNAEPTPLLQSQVYKILYESVLYCLFIFLVPLCLLVFMNTCLIRELVNARKRRLQRGMPCEEEENNLTLVMVIIVLIFVVCQTPALFNAMIYATGVLQYQCGHGSYYYFHFSNLFVTANSAANFIVYFAFRKQFRQRLRAFCYHTPISHSEYDEVSGKSISVHKHTISTNNGSPLN